MTSPGPGPADREGPGLVDEELERAGAVGTGGAVVEGGTVVAIWATEAGDPPPHADKLQAARAIAPVMTVNRRVLKMVTKPPSIPGPVVRGTLRSLSAWRMAG
ncbi:MAG TPA: hypothetical protein VL984_14970 [Acidimicrobiales bacterium]|nr:hypothetical protein [Acidimicrobiales bacterium]